MDCTNAHLLLINRFFAEHVDASAQILENMAEGEASAVLQSLPPETAVRALKNLQISYAADLLRDADEAFLSEVARRLDPQWAAAVLMHLGEASQERIAAHLPDKLKESVRELLEYPEGSVGRIMSTEFLSFREDLTAQEAIERIRQLSKKKYPLSYAYVVDGGQHLIGVLNMRDLMLAPGDKKLGDIIRRDVFTIHCFTDRVAAAGDLAKRKYFAAPVVDSDNRLLGIIKAERMIQGIQEDVAGNLQRMFGVGKEERAFSPIKLSLSKRLPWLHVNLATAFLAAFVVALFEGVIAKLTILAVFLPVVAGQGGNAGAQSLAVVMRGLVMREIPDGKRVSLVMKEVRLGAINGAVIGVVTAAVAWIWYGNPYLGVVIGLGMLINLVCAGISGASIPLVMKKIGIDPAQSSSIILTTVTDVVGFVAFLGLAVVFQDFLV